MVLLALLACTPDEAPSACGADEVEIDGGVCVPAACGQGRWGALDPGDGDVFVAAGADGDGTMDAPFGSIQAGLDAAADAGAARVLVAVGTYREVLGIRKLHNGVSLEGRCKELVTLDGSEGPDEEGVLTVGDGIGTAAHVSGMTITGGRYGGVLSYQGTVTLRDVDVVDNALIGIGAIHADIEVDGVRVADTRMDEHGDWGWGVHVEGGEVRGTGLSVEANHTYGIYASGRGSNVNVAGCRVADTLPNEDGAGGWGILAQAGPEITLSDCAIADNLGAGLFADASPTVVTLDRTTITGTTPNDDGDAGWGLVVQSGAVVTGTDVELRGNTQIGLSTYGEGTAVTLAGVTIADTAVSPEAGDGGGGVVAVGGAAVDLTDATLTGNASFGVSAAQAGSTVRLSTARIADTVADDAGTFPVGLYAFAGATVEGEGVTIVGNPGYGVLVADAGSGVSLSDCTVEGTLPYEGAWGRGVQAEDGGDLRLEGCAITGNQEVAVTAADATVTLVDTEVSGTRPNAEGYGGYGAQIGLGATLQVDGGTFADNVGAGIYAFGAGVTVTLDDTTITGTALNANGRFGRGLELADGAAATLTDATIAESHEAGIVVSDATLTMTDTTVRDTRVLADGRMGYGVILHEGATATIAGGALTGNVEVGLLARDAGTTVTLRDTAVTGTLRGNTVSTATGVAISGGATLDATGLDASANGGPGLYVAVAGTVACTACTFSGDSFAGVVLLDGTATLTDTTISAIAADPGEGGGVGVFADGQYAPTALTLDGVTIGAQPLAAVWLHGSGRYLLQGGAFTGGAGETLDRGPHEGPHLHGDAVFATGGIPAWDDTVGLRIEGATLADSSGAGLFLDDATATLVDPVWRGNTVDVVQQLCREGVSAPVGIEAAGTTSICPGEDQLVESLSYALVLGEAEALE